MHISLLPQSSSYGRNRRFRRRSSAEKGRTERRTSRARWSGLMGLFPGIAARWIPRCVPATLRGDCQPPVSHYATLLGRSSAATGSAADRRRFRRERSLTGCAFEECQPDRSGDACARSLDELIAAQGVGKLRAHVCVRPGRVWPVLDAASPDNVEGVHSGTDGTGADP